MQPRFRAILWKELPPFVRRACVGWSRSLLHAELFLGHIYINWTKSPTWNFVGIAGALGILLTLLLFLVPREFLGETHSGGKGRTSRLTQERRPWELDATLSVAARARSYPVEVEFRPSAHPVSKVPVQVAADAPQRRRRPYVAEDPPLMPLFAPEPIAQAPTLGEQRTDTPDIDWFEDIPHKTAVIAEETPQLDVEWEFIPARRRRTREPVVEDVTLTARTETDHLTHHSERDFDPHDPWRTFDPSQAADRDESSGDVLVDHEAVVASLDGDGSLWEPPEMPGSASSAVEIDLELSWDRTARSSSRRWQRVPQLHIRNVGSAAVPRIDVLRGELPETDFTVAQRLSSQTLPALPPGQEHAVAEIGSARRRSSRAGVASVLVTAFVGNETTALAAVVERPAPQAEPVESPPPRPRQPAPVREVKRPHLTLTIGKPSRLREHHMFSTPLRVVNDGNVTLDDVVIVAEIPTTLDHRYGRIIHHRIGSLRPNEERRTFMLLTPLETGLSTVKLEAADGDQSAMDTGELALEVTPADLTTPQKDRSTVQPVAAEEPRPRSPRRRNSGASRESGF